MQMLKERTHHHSRQRGKRKLDQSTSLLSTLSTSGTDSCDKIKRMRPFNRRLALLAASVAAFSLSSSILWIAKIPSSGAPTIEMRPQVLRHSVTSSLLRKPKILAKSAKSDIAPFRRLEGNLDEAKTGEPSFSTPKKRGLTFHRIAQHGSTTQRDYVKLQEDALEFIEKEVDLNVETGRSTRFPSVDQRVRVYMSNWYLPPCPVNTDHHVVDSKVKDTFVEYNFQKRDTADTEYMIFREVRTAKEKLRGPLRTFVVDDSPGFDFIRHLNPDLMLNCKHTSYCTDFVKYLFPAMKRAETVALNSSMNEIHDVSDKVLMYQFSDAEKTLAFNTGVGRLSPYPNVPILKKFRYAISKKELKRILTPSSADLQCATAPRPVPLTIEQQQRMNEGETKLHLASQPIIIKQKIQRHYGYVQQIPGKDREWSAKKNQAIFRGQFTGRFLAGGMKMDMIKKLSPLEQCNLLHRCRLVYNSSFNSTLVDAKLALPILDVRKDFPQVINDIPLYSERVSIEDMLSYKAIIMLEGNDVSSGLKWALYSNSVVLTQTPTKTSWAMEELLEPWVHYIPLADDLSDVEEKMQWVLDNDAEAQKIALRGKLWIHDLVFHPDSDSDEQLIFDEILRRYKAHFLHNPSMELPAGNIEFGGSSTE